MKLKLICLNLWQGGNLFDEIVTYIKKEQPDILACQEVFNSHDTTLEIKYRSVDALQEIFNYPYVSFEPCFAEKVAGQQIDQGNAIFSKFPITQSDVTFFDQPYGVRPEEDPKYYEITPRNIQHVAIDAQGTTLNVYNVQGIWGKDGWDNERRLAMSQTILDTIGDANHVILTGDFNVQPKTDTIRALEAKFKNIYKDELVTSFNMKHKTDQGYATAVVDMLFTTPDITISKHVVAEDDVSDHLSLIAEIELP